MPSYFRQVPDFEYVSRLPDARISDYINVKNLFKKGKLREDIFQNLAYFTKYKVRGDDRPDNVAFEIYGDATLDWIVLLSNNILNIQTEWPLPQSRFDEFLLNKYGDYNTLYNGIHHYESPEIKNTQDVVIVAKGLQVDSNFSINYYDSGLERNITQTNIAVPVTNYEYEIQIEDDKRNIYLLKPQYLNIVYDDMNELMTYKKGSTQYKSGTLKRADNIRLYE